HGHDGPAEAVMDYLHPADTIIDRRADNAAGGRYPEDGRGRSAEAPSQIPVRGWKDILLRVYNGITEDRILANAAAVTFYALLALFPAIAALVSIYGLFADPSTIAKQLDLLSGVLPGGALDVIRDQLTRVTEHGSTTLGISFLIGLVVALWSANGGIKAMFDALNTVYEEKEKRGFIRLTLVTLAFTVAMLGLVIVAIVCVVALPAILKYLPGFMATVLDIARWPIIAVLVAIALACIYRFGPSRDEAKWHWLSWGSGFAAIGWLAVSALFSYYAANFGGFNKTYGSLGAVMAS
ncbi:MAG: YihY/virulence factor BrkB family protein, partial [Bradyrhizobium sp.]